MTRAGKVQTLLAFGLALALMSGQRASASLADDPHAVTLPLDLEVNGVAKGEAIVRATPALDQIELHGGLLKELLRSLVAPEFAAVVEALPDQFVSMARLRELSLEIDLDLERLVISLNVPERREPSLEVVRALSLDRQRTPRSDAYTPEARISGYANLRWRTSRSESHSAPSRIAHTLGISHVLNIGGYAVEGDSTWSERFGFETRHLRLVRDLPSRMWRISFGDVATPIADLQQGSQLFGASLAKEFGIQPYRTFTPTGSASFRLDEAATVHVTLNGRSARSLRLDPGEYRIEDFKLVAGSNTMELEILTESGLADTLNVAAFGSFSLLGEGVSAYALSLGLPRVTTSDEEAFTLSSASWYERHLERRPQFSGYYRRGFTQALTGTASLQGSEDWARVGIGISTAGPLAGEVDLELSGNALRRDSSSCAGRLRWSRSLGGFGVAASSHYSGKGFQRTKLRQNVSPNTVEWSHSLRVSRLIRESLNVALNLYHQTSHDGFESLGAHAELGRRIGSIYAQASLRYAHVLQDEPQFGGYLAFTWNPAPKWRARSRIRMSEADREPELSTLMSYASRNGGRYTSGSINLRRSEEGYDFDGSLAVRDSTWGLRVDHRELYHAIDAFTNRGRETTLTVETALAFADGSFGLAHNVRDSFAVVDLHEAWEDAALGINPSLGGFERIARRGKLNPVLSNLVSYREGYATIEAIEGSHYLDRNDYYFKPGYRRGARLLIGSDAIYSLRSVLYYSDGEPVAYRALQLKRPGEEPITTFSNATGRFVASELRPGRYTLEVAGTQESTTIEIRTGDTLVLLDRVDLQPGKQ